MRKSTYNTVQQYKPGRNFEIQVQIQRTDYSLDHNSLSSEWLCGHKYINMLLHILLRFLFSSIMYLPEYLETKTTQKELYQDNKMNKTPNLNAFFVDFNFKIQSCLFTELLSAFLSCSDCFIYCEFPIVKLLHTHQIKKSSVKNYSYDYFPSQTKFMVTALKLKRLWNVKYFLCIFKGIQYETVIISNSVTWHLLQRENDRSRCG